MKTTILAQLSALTLSAVFATVATLGVAFVMAGGSDRAPAAGEVTLAQVQGAPHL